MEGKVRDIYKNLSGQSNVREYEIGPDYITVHFASGSNEYYKYDYATTGRDTVEKMKQLAEQGFGLNSYISKFVRGNYATKW